MRWRGAPLPSLKQCLSAGAIGILLLSCGNGGVTVAEHWGVASGVAALAVATVPLFTLLFGRFFGNRTNALEWAGIALGLLGIVLLNLGSNLQGSPAGAGLILFAAATWAFGSVWSRRLDLPAGAMASAVEMLVGGGVLLLGSLLSGERLEQMPTAAGWGALAYLVVFGSIIAFSAYMYLLANVRPAAATSYAYVNPAVAVMLGVVFAGEHIGLAESGAGDGGDHQRGGLDRPAAVATRPRELIPERKAPAHRRLWAGAVFSGSGQITKKPWVPSRPSCSTRPNSQSR